MNITELKEFLTKFEIKTENIEEFTNNKEIVELNNNTYLLEKDYNKLKNEISNDKLIYIQLKSKVPSILFLKWIKENTNNVLKIKSEKRALDFTYGKELFTDLVSKSTKTKLTIEKYYIVEFDNEILGYVKMAEKTLTNKFHIGDLLKEN